MLLQNDAGRQPLYSLNDEEINDPYLVIDELFDFADLAEAQELLWLWLKTTVTGTYHKNLPATDRSVIITMYEKMEKLMAAAYVLHDNANAQKKKKLSRNAAKGQGK